MFEEMKDIVQELESDNFIRGSSSWIHVMDRYQENIDRLREILEDIE